MLSILKFNLIYYIKNTEECIYIASYFIIINFIFDFYLDDKFRFFQELHLAGQWIGLFVCICLASNQLYERDADFGVLETCQQLPLSIYSIVFAKLIASFSAVCIAIVIGLPIVFILSNQEIDEMPQAITNLAAGGVGMIIIGNLTASLSIGFKRGRALSILLAFPLTIPILIFGGANIVHQNNIFFLVSYAIFLLPILCLVAASSIRSSN